MPLKQNRYEYFMDETRQGLSSTRAKLSKFDQECTSSRSNVERNIGDHCIINDGRSPKYDPVDVRSVIRKRSNFHLFAISRLHRGCVRTDRPNARIISSRYHHVRATVRRNIESDRLYKRKPLRYRFADVRNRTIGRSTKTIRRATRQRFVVVRRYRTKIAESKPCILSVNGLDIKRRFIQARLFYIKLHFGDVRKKKLERLTKTLLRFGGVRFDHLQTSNASAKVYEINITEIRFWKLDIWSETRPFARIINPGILAEEIQPNICSEKPQKHDLPNKIPGRFCTCFDKSDIKSIRDINQALGDRVGSKKHTSVPLARGGRPFNREQSSIGQSLGNRKFRRCKSSHCDIPSVDFDVSSAEILTIVSVVSESIKAEIIQDYGRCSSRNTSAALRLINSGYIGTSCNKLNIVRKITDYNQYPAQLELRSQQSKTGSIEKRVSNQATNCLERRDSATIFRTCNSGVRQEKEAIWKSNSQPSKRDLTLSDDRFETGCDVTTYYVKSGFDVTVTDSSSDDQFETSCDVTTHHSKGRFDVSLIDSPINLVENNQNRIEASKTLADIDAFKKKRKSVITRLVIIGYWITVMASFWLCMHPGDCAEIGIGMQCPSGCSCYNDGQVRRNIIT